MVSLGHQSLPSTDLGRLDAGGASPGRRPLQVVSCVTLSRLRQRQAHEIHHGKWLDVRLSLTVALSTMQMTA
ncbi:hypothetical protein TNCV_3394551 [Trichonephila clavipes]|nr:hypothetical protein TNCV_3394551 [Trichonephila clavipes]